MSKNFFKYMLNYFFLSQLFKIYRSSSGIQEDDIETMHPKISVRSTVSLPCVSATNPTYFPYHSSSNRLV